MSEIPSFVHLNALRSLKIHERYATRLPLTNFIECPNLEALKIEHYTEELWDIPPWIPAGLSNLNFNVDSNTTLPDLGTTIHPSHLTINIQKQEDAPYLRVATWIAACLNRLPHPKHLERLTIAIMDAQYWDAPIYLDLADYEGLYRAVKSVHAHGSLKRVDLSVIAHQGAVWTSKLGELFSPILGDLEEIPSAPNAICNREVQALDGDKRTLKSCSLVCNEWRTFSLPFLYRRLSINTRYQLLACMTFMQNAPHIRPYVRVLRSYYDVPEAAEAEDDGLEISDSALEIDEGDIKSFIHSLTRLDGISRSAYPIFDIPDVLPASSVTTLYIGDYSPEPHEVIQLFQASASKIRTLIFHDIRIYNVRPAADTLHMPTITMGALEQLALSCSGKMFPFYGKVKMPKLKFLLCEGWYSTLREDFPDSLVTLVVNGVYDHDYHRPFSVENLSINWDHRLSSLDEISDLSKRLAIPSKIQHLEIVLPYLHDAETIDDFESFILDLHDNGSLRKLTFTFTSTHRDEPRGAGLADRLTKLGPLGILDVQEKAYSILQPEL
ncbi:hypothetical protein EYR38_005024 [Pleurotus pulmonarius]|nr:hypothetical protein EYR38_005024 [Pleurotus pulmonarius]